MAAFSRVEQFQKKERMSYRACTIYQQAFYMKRLASTWLDNQVQELSQLRY